MTPDFISVIKTGVGHELTYLQISHKDTFISTRFPVDKGNYRDVIEFHVAPEQENLVALQTFLIIQEILEE